MKKLGMLLGLVAFLAMVNTANAHLVTFAWVDNGNGTVTLWGEHWHGDQAGPSTANGGIHITDPAAVNPPFLAQWTGHINNVDRDTMIGNGTLTGYQADASNCCSGQEDDWFFTDPLVIGNGTWNFFTGTNCCIDTMTAPVQVTLTGITSVPGGTGPGGTPAVPEPSTVLLLGLGLAGLGLYGRKRVLDLG